MVGFPGGCPHDQVLLLKPQQYVGSGGFTWWASPGGLHLVGYLPPRRLNLLKERELVLIHASSGQPSLCLPAIS